MKVVAAKFITGEEVLARKREAATFTEPQLLAIYGKEVYSDVRVVAIVHTPQGPALRILPFVSLAPDMELTQEQWDALAVMNFEPPTEIEKSYLASVSKIQLG